VKKIWTPSWTLFSGGVCFLFLAAFSWVVDIRKHRGIAFPLVVVGMNSIAAYLIAGLGEEFVERSLSTNLGPSVLNVLGPALEPTVLGALTLGVFWLMLFWMFRKRLFIRI
jgi:predicted acyltransferase